MPLTILFTSITNADVELITLDSTHFTCSLSRRKLTTSPISIKVEYKKPRSRMTAKWISVEMLAINVSEVDEGAPYQVTLTSDNEGLSLAFLSSECEIVSNEMEFFTSDQNRVDSYTTSGGKSQVTSAPGAIAQSLTFNRFGRFTLSRHSSPSLASVRAKKTLYLHVLAISTVTSKTYNITVGALYGYPRGEVYLVALASFVIGILLIFVYAGMFRVSLKEYFFGKSGHDGSRIKQLLCSYTMVIKDWFRRGTKDYSYLTLFLGTTLFVGAYQVRHF